MKRVYEEPMAYEESFMANEYVAACYYLACRVGTDGYIQQYLNGWYKNPDYLWKTAEEGKGISHAPLKTSGTCADRYANRVITDDGGIFKNVQENNSATGGQGWIDGGYDGYLDMNGNGKMDTGDRIYWHTLNAGKDRKWNHYGTLEAADSSHPNHS